MNMIVTAKVITQADKHSCLNLVQFGNWEWVIVIEIINAAGWVLPFMVIFASKTHCMVWFENINLLLNWTIAVNDNDWITDALEFK